MSGALAPFFVAARSIQTYASRCAARRGWSSESLGFHPEALAASPTARIHPAGSIATALGAAHATATRRCSAARESLGLTAQSAASRAAVTTSGVATEAHDETAAATALAAAQRVSESSVSASVAAAAAAPGTASAAVTNSPALDSTHAPSIQVSASNASSSQISSPSLLCQAGRNDAQSPAAANTLDAVAASTAAPEVLASASVWHANRSIGAVAGCAGGVSVSFASCMSVSSSSSSPTKKHGGSSAAAAFQYALTCAAAIAASFVFAAAVFVTVASSLPSQFSAHSHRDATASTEVSHASIPVSSSPSSSQPSPSFPFGKTSA